MLASTGELARVYRASDRLLRDRNLFTFGTQLLQAVNSLRSDAALLRAAARAISATFSWTSFRTPTSRNSSCSGSSPASIATSWLVGDDDQAIYRFRGASFGSFTIFLKRFCGVREPQARPRRRHETSRLAFAELPLHAANSARGGRSDLPQRKIAAASLQKPSAPKITTAKKSASSNSRAPIEEALWVASEIERLHEAGAPWRSFAVLYRKHAHREHLLAALRAERIPFVIRKFSILSITLVRDLFAWLRLIGEPADNVACARVLAAPYWGLEPRDLVRLAERAEKNHHRPLSDETRNRAAVKLLSTRPGVRLGELVAAPRTPAPERPPQLHHRSSR